MNTSKKFWTGAICIVLSAIMLFTLIACKKDNGAQDPVSVVNGQYFVENGASDYVVVIPEDADETLTFAAQELVDNVELATGATLSVVTDADASADARMISLGQTSQYEAVANKIPLDELGADGYKIYTVDDDTYCVGNSSYAAVNAVYGLLNAYFDYRYYAENSFNLVRAESAPLLRFNVTDIPDIEYRALATREVDYSTEHRRRLRILSLYEGWGRLYAHTYFVIVPYDQYKTDHRDWYSSDGKNLCLTHVDRSVFAANLVDIIKEQPDSPYVMIGQQDSFDFCECADCQAKVTEWRSKGAYSTDSARAAIMMDFNNEIARKVKEALPERDIELVSFAYNPTKMGPVRQLEDGTFELLDPSLKAEDNLGVMVVPYNAPYNYDYYDETNVSIRAQFDTWKDVTDNLYVWLYDTNFDDYSQPFPSWGSLAGNCRFFEDYGAKWVFFQGSYNMTAINFGEMKQFVTAQLMWDNSQSTEELIDEFMLAYYQEAAGALKEYFNVMNSKYAQFAADGKLLYSFGEGFTGSDCWSYEFLNNTCLRLFEEAFDAISIYEQTDRAKYSVLYDRILKETLFVRKMLLDTYSSQIENVAQMRSEFDEDCAKFGISGFTEAG